MPRGVVVRVTGGGAGGASQLTGQWVPVDFWGAVGFSSVNGWYWRTGNMVNVVAVFTIAVTASATVILVRGLPFGALNVTYNNVPGSGFGDPVRGYVYPHLDAASGGVGAFRLRNANGVALTYAQLSGVEVRVAFTYRAA